MTKRTIEQQIAEANDRLLRLKARQKKVEVRQQIVLGAAMISVGRKEARCAKVILALLDQATLREAEARDIAPVIKELRQVVDEASAMGTDSAPAPDSPPSPSGS